MAIRCFVLASGRSGTHYLSWLLEENVTDAACVQEPNFSPFNPPMFGRATYWRLSGDTDHIRALVRRKQKWIDRRKEPHYVETSHAFLKSYADVAMEFFPEMKLIHLIRHPLKTALSEANREIAARRTPFRFMYCFLPEGSKYFWWALTALESIYQSFRIEQLSLFQRYAIQWIEIENRAMSFLDRYRKHEDCVTLHSPADLNDSVRMSELIRQLGLTSRQARVEPPGPKGKLIRRRYVTAKNRTPGAPTILGEKEEREFQSVVRQLPAEFLRIFQREPYSGMEWVRFLRS